MSYQKKYHELCEKHLRLEQHNDFLQRELKRAEEARLSMLEEIVTLEARQKNSDNNRQFIDDATNWLGPFHKRLLFKIQMLAEEIGEIRHMHDAYYSVGMRYPWQTE